ncbi:hypothetical protein KOM00_01360 [Geomonas sp. Red69]|uniref:Uncharacterized protein n=1 Tax=Geomonas diazotrophica TaxID=2843197 RepID=A0ABX8JHV4_9BACT|nr:MULTISPECIES: hypothetical protein [Geomonas]MBU5635378.1 hypothetical protein [Geomonas diazotrophica]QWV97566.1 hypothetical protein KP005_19905 [Geomonas nitrogeniifigens]QXE86707.1 hypothetical protein KP003_20560 [Geomonas nitrogeniifigens]
MAKKESRRNDQEEQQRCAACRGEETFPYWCETCGRSVPEKRCPYCGLKAQKKKG